MTTITKQAAIEAVRSVPAGTTCRGEAIIAALNALPAVDYAAEINGLKDALAQAEGVIADLRAQRYL